MENNHYFIRPNIPKGSHPIETGDYIIGTPATFGMFQTIYEWIEMRQPGGVVFGPPRFGKTRAIAYIAKQLETKFEGHLPIVNFHCREHAYPNENVFFEEFLTALGHGFSTRGKSVEKRGRLSEFLRCMGADNPHSRLVFFLDEAQNLQPQHYKWLIDIYNDLDMSHVRSTFILVGQKELAARRKAFVIAKRFQIVGRFMVNVHQFPGLSSPEEIQVCLHGYDENSEHPKGSGWSFTRFFFPTAYVHGWRLASQAETIWQAFMEVKMKARLPGEDELPMQFFSHSIEYVMRKYENLVDVEPHLSLQIWKEAVEKSGYHLCGDFITAEGFTDDYH
jgi:hypothetical protein